MPLDNTKVGPNFVPAYQISSVPYVTSSATDVEVGTSTPLRVPFPEVTRYLVVTNTGDSELKVGFSENGILGKGAYSSSLGTTTPANTAAKNYFIVPASGTMSPRLEVRCTELWLLCKGGSGETTGFSLVAGMTGIQSSMFPVLTGSSGIQGVG